MREMKTRELQDVNGFASATGIAVQRCAQILEGGAITSDERDRLREFIGKGTWRLIAKDLGFASSSEETISTVGSKIGSKSKAGSSIHGKPRTVGLSSPTMAKGRHRRQIAAHDLPDAKPTTSERLQQIPADMDHLLAGLREDLAIARKMNAQMSDRVDQLEQIVKFWTRLKKAH